MIGFLCLYANGEYKTGFTNCSFVKLLGENESGTIAAGENWPSGLRSRGGDVLRCVWCVVGCVSVTGGCDLVRSCREVRNFRKEPAERLNVVGWNFSSSNLGANRDYEPANSGNASIDCPHGDVCVGRNLTQERGLCAGPIDLKLAPSYSPSLHMWQEQDEVAQWPKCFVPCQVGFALMAGHVSTR
jgi:hypothetical protein